MVAAAISDFHFMWIWPFRRVDSVVFVFCTKFGPNICYSHWDRHTFFRLSFDDVTRIIFWFRLLVTLSSPRRCGASSHIIWCEISLSSPKLLTFLRNSRWRPTPSWIFSLCEFGHSGVLAVWYLCTVPNLVQISVIVTEIDSIEKRTVYGHLRQQFYPLTHPLIINLCGYTSPMTSSEIPITLTSSWT